MAKADPEAADSLADWAATLGLGPDDMAMLRSGVEEMWCRPTEDLSFRIVHHRAVTGEDADEDTLEYSCVEGLGTLALRMAAALRPALRLDTPVAAVDRHADQFHLTTPQGQVHALHLVIAANPVVLHRIMWRSAQDHGLATFGARFAPRQMRKIMLRYADAFWRGSDFGWLGQTDDPPGLAVIDSSDAAGGFDALTVFAGGRPAAKWSALSEPQVLAQLMDVLEPMPMPAVRAPVTVMQADWTGHPWVGGGYNSWPRLWRDDDPMARMMTPHAGLHFAGAEIAHHYPGHVDGALRSGVAVAQRILHEG